MKIYALYFSPTHTGQRIVQAAASGLALPLTEYDITLPAARKQFLAAVPQPAADDVVLLEGPVYGGRLCSLALQAFGQLKGTGQPAVLFALYGNRNFDEAGQELYDLAVQTGFRPIGFGAFIGEHSFSQTLAAGRPDASDLALAEHFGKALREKLSGTAVPLKREQIPFCPRTPLIRSHGQVLKGLPGPDVDNERCTGCGRCVAACPVGNLVQNKETGKAENTRTACLHCRACARVCPVQAVDFHGTSYAWLIQNCQENFGRVRKGNLLVL